MAVVHLDDLDVVISRQRRGDLAREPDQQVDTDAHVGGIDDRDDGGGTGKRFAVCGRQPGRTADQGDTEAGRQLCIGGRQLWRREIDHGIRAGKKSFGVTR